MKLYELEKGDKFKLAGDNLSPEFIFDHIDGMYSLCYLFDHKKGEVTANIVHLGASSPVIRIANE